MPKPCESVGDRMLFAVDDLNENPKRVAPKDPKSLTEEFWAAFTEFAPEYLVGRISIDTNGTDILIRFRPE